MTGKTTKVHKREGKCPRPEIQVLWRLKLSNIKINRASIQSEAAEGQRHPRMSIDLKDIIKVINDFETDLKRDNECLRQ